MTPLQRWPFTTGSLPTGQFIFDQNPNSAFCSAPKAANESCSYFGVKFISYLRGHQGRDIHPVNLLSPPTQPTLQQFGVNDGGLDFQHIAKIAGRLVGR